MRAAMLSALGALLVCSLAWTEAATTGTLRSKIPRAHALPTRVSNFRAFQSPTSIGQRRHCCSRAATGLPGGHSLSVGDCLLF